MQLLLKWTVTEAACSQLSLKKPMCLVLSETLNDLTSNLIFYLLYYFMAFHRVMYVLDTVNSYTTVKGYKSP